MSVQHWSADPQAITALYRAQTGKDPVPGDAVRLGTTRWVMQSGGTWEQSPAPQRRTEHR